MSTETTIRGYVHVTREGATFYLPRGGRWAGGTETVRVREGTAPGWYRCVGLFVRRWSIDLGARIDPAREADRLERLADRATRARTRSPGVSGFLQREAAANAALAAKRQRQHYFAEILRAAGE